MPKGNVNVLELKTRERCSVVEKGGEVLLHAGDPLSALQAVARQAGLQIFLSQEEMARFAQAGRFEISLHYANNASGATEAAKRIDQMAAEAALAQSLVTGKRRSIGKKVGLLLLALAISAVMFMLTVAVLDSIYGSHIMSQFLP